MNVVFDLGGVVFDWRPDELLGHTFADPRTRARVKSGLLEHQDWVELDRGSISADDAIARAASRTGLPREEIGRFLDAVPQSLAPIAQTINLISDVRQSGSSIYILSNMHHASIDFLEREHAIWGLFDGAVISCRVNKVKPEADIYRHLLAEFRLQAAATLFIDDLRENVVAAEAAGIRSIQFASPAQCRVELENMGCIKP